MGSKSIGALNKFIMAVTVAVTLVLAACNFEIKDAQDSPTDEGALLATSKIDFALMQTAVLNECSQCHKGSRTPILGSLEEFQRNLDQVWTFVSHRAMPPSHPLSTCKIAALKSWITQGTPEHSEVVVASLPECLPSTPKNKIDPIQNQPLSYKIMLSEILGRRCLTCHNMDEPSDAAKVLFDDYDRIMEDTKHWQAPGNTSTVFQRLTDKTDKRMPPPDKNGNPPLTPEEINYIVRWIDAGKPR